MANPKTIVIPWKTYQQMAAATQHVAQDTTLHELYETYKDDMPSGERAESLDAYEGAREAVGFIDEYESLFGDLTDLRIIHGVADSRPPDGNLDSLREHAGDQWKVFLDTGLLWAMNTFLHIFGWAIHLVEDLDTGQIWLGFPQRVGSRHRGFHQVDNQDGYATIDTYMEHYPHEVPNYD